MKVNIMFMEVFDRTTFGSIILSFGVSVPEWLSDFDVNNLLQGGVFLVTIILGAMKIYHLYLTTKKLKEK